MDPCNRCIRGPAVLDYAFCGQMYDMENGYANTTIGADQS